jgi:hypothetical protein
MSIGTQIIWLFVLGIPVACIAWTVTHEEVFHEPRNYCARQSQHASSALRRKFFYLFTCEYCFSHYVVILFLAITRYKLLYTDWRGYLVGGFALVWVANIYMSLFGRLRLDIKREHVEIEREQVVTEKNKQAPPENEKRAA